MVYMCAIVGVQVCVCVFLLMYMHMYRYIRTVPAVHVDYP
jgi:hypothetical protein